MSWKVHLSWEEGAPSAQGTGFKVYRSVDGGAYSLIATLGISTLSYDDTNVSEGHKYSYHVTEYNDINGGESPAAAITVYLPSPNTSLDVRIYIDGSVYINWDQRAYNRGYRLERQIDGGAWELVAETGVNDTDYTDSVGTTTGKTYQYRVRPKGTADYAPAWKTSGDHYYATKKVHLSWNEGGTAKPAEHGDGYKIYRSTDGTNYVWWDTIADINTTTYDDPDITDGAYYYKVVEYKDNFEDEPATVSVEVVLNSAPTAPTGLLCNGQTNPTAVDTPIPPLSAIYNDPDPGDIAKYYQLQIASDSGFSNIVYDSGKMSLPSDVTEGNRCPNLFPSSLPLNGQKYWWRIRFWDDDDAEGEWSTE